MKLKKSLRRSFARYLTFVLRTLRHGGVGVFETTIHRQERQARAELFRTAKRLADSAVADVLVEHHRTGRALREKKLPKLRMLVGDDARVALLQSDWTKESARLLVDFSQPHVMVELSHRSQVLLRGAWQPIVSVDSAELTRPTAWEVLFSYSDADVDVLEIEQRFAGDWQLQRQFVLGKQDAFLFAADLLVGPRDGPLSYQLASAADGRVASSSRPPIPANAGSVTNAATPCCCPWQRPNGGRPIHGRAACGRRALPARPARDESTTVRSAVRRLSSTPHPDGMHVASPDRG